jgi:Zn-dependent M28 family amino/carboxypeptidase
MHCAEMLIALLAGVMSTADFSGHSALEFTRKAVLYGPRPPGSEANRKLAAFIAATAKRFGAQAEVQTFSAMTPLGPLPMNNVVARFPGTSGKAIVLSGHFDTKRIPGILFVGANDGGSSTGFLLEMARVLGSRKNHHDIYLVWFDGEESFGRWSREDSLYGSRHLARKWAADGALKRIVALINVDMIGDRDLDIMNEMLGSPRLRSLIWSTARELGLAKHFLEQEGATEDDHIPFVELGVEAVDLIDFNYGPMNAWWHTEEDTMDKLSARSFEVVGRVLLAVIAKLENR